MAEHLSGQSRDELFSDLGNLIIGYIPYLGPKLWNKLTKEVRNLPSLRQFKTHIRKSDLSALLESDCKGCTLCGT